MKLLLLLFLGVLSAIDAQIQIDTLPRKLGEVDQIRVPAFADVHRSSDSTLPYEDQFTLYVSTFNAAAFGQTDSVFYLRAPGRHIANTTNWPLQLLEKNSYWPNNPDILPPGIVTGYEGVIQTSGFLVPTKTAGKLQLYNMDDPNPSLTEVNIASDDVKDYSYHRVLWKDMDGDGDLDAVTARFHNTVEEQRFTWMENTGRPVKGWIQHDFIEQGPDVHFRNMVLNSNGVPHDCFVAGELWNLRATLYCIRLGVQDGWNNPANILNRTIDDTVGQVFDLLLEDFDLDGNVDLLFTAYDDAFLVKEGKVYIYTIPTDLFQGTWGKHVIASGFTPNQGQNLMSPGTPISFYPSDAYANEVLPGDRRHRKWIIVSGDDDGNVYILRPTTETVDNWAPYEKAILVDTGAQTAGKPAIGDFDGDGYTDIIAPGYSANKIFTFTYAPL